MKKFLIIPLSIFLFLSGISYVEAKANFAPVEENNKASLNIKFDTGYVGGIELKAKLSGDITVTGINFNSNFKDYTKRYHYDKNSKVLTIYIATGNNKKNLLDKNRNMNIGTLNVTSPNSDEKYSIELQSVSIVDASYASKEEKDITTEKNSFIANKQESSNTNSNTNSNSNNTNSNSNKNTNTNSNNQVNGSNTNSNSNSSSNEKPNTNTNTDTNSNTNSLSNSSTNSTNSSTNNSNKEEETIEKKSNSILPYILIGIGVLAIVGVIAFIIKKKRD